MTFVVLNCVLPLPEGHVAWWRDHLCTVFLRASAMLIHIEYGDVHIRRYLPACGGVERAALTPQHYRTLANGQLRMSDHSLSFCT